MKATKDNIMSDHPTREVNADIIRLIVEMREDICNHLHNIEANVQKTKQDVEGLKNTNKKSFWPISKTN